SPRPGDARRGSISATSTRGSSNRRASGPARRASIEASDIAAPRLPRFAVGITRGAGGVWRAGRRVPDRRRGRLGGGARGQSGRSAGHAPCAGRLAIASSGQGRLPRGLVALGLLALEFTVGERAVAPSRPERIEGDLRSAAAIAAIRADVAVIVH